MDGMTFDKLLFNELADEAARIGSITFTNTGTVKEDSVAKYELQKIARRLAAIEVSMWKDEPDFKKHHGKDFAQLKEQRAMGVKRKADEAIDSTTGEDQHALYVEGVWHKRRGCNGMAHAKNQK